MPVLKNAKHEKFAQGLAKGMNAEAAYVGAGYKAHRGNAHRLSTNEDVLERVQELKEKIAEKAEWSAADRLKMLSNIAERTEKSSPKAAVSAISEANKMQGSYAPTRSEINLVVSLSDDDLDRELSGLLGASRAK